MIRAIAQRISATGKPNHHTINAASDMRRRHNYESARITTTPKTRDYGDVDCGNLWWNTHRHSTTKPDTYKITNSKTACIGRVDKYRLCCVMMKDKQLMWHHSKHSGLHGHCYHPIFNLFLIAYVVGWSKCVGLQVNKKAKPAPNGAGETNETPCLDDRCHPQGWD